jgi:hypothetical protein
VLGFITGSRSDYQRKNPVTKEEEGDDDDDDNDNNIIIIIN